MIPSVPRPVTASADQVAQALADYPVSLVDVATCQAVCVEVFGREPEVDWISVRCHAMRLRKAVEARSPVPGLIPLIAVGILGAFALAAPQPAAASCGPLVAFSVVDFGIGASFGLLGGVAIFALFAASLVRS